MLMWFKAIERQHGYKAANIHTDGGGEFVPLEAASAQLGFAWTITSPHTSEHNPIVERANRYVVEAARSILYHAAAPLSLWGEACAYAILTRNMTAIRKGTKLSPMQLWSPQDKPSAVKLRVPLCDAWVHIPDADRQKLDAKATIGIFLGFDSDGHYYKVLVVTSMKIIRSREVRFDETSFTQCKALRDSQLCSDDAAFHGAAASDSEFVDFLQDSRYRAEVRLAEIVSQDLANVGIETSELAPVAASPVVAVADDHDCDHSTDREPPSLALLPSQSPTPATVLRDAADKSRLPTVGEELPSQNDPSPEWPSSGCHR